METSSRNNGPEGTGLKGAEGKRNGIPSNRQDSESDVTVGLQSQVNRYIVPRTIEIGKTAIKTPLRYPGGKTRVADKLASLMPNFKEYREPFIGGGSVFIAAKQSKPDLRYWINDLFYDVYSFWTSTRDNCGNVLSIVRELKDKFPDGRSLFTQLNEHMTEFTGVDRAAAFFVMNRITFSGTSLSGGYSQGSYDGRFNEASMERVSLVSPLLDDVKITNEDYSVLLRDGGESVFIFLDPPYYSATKSALYGRNGDIHRGLDHERFANEVKACSHKWMITYDDCEYTRKLFEGYNIVPFELMYGMRNVTKDADMKGKELLITNY